jgi:hypothetical protein
MLYAALKCRSSTVVPAESRFLSRRRWRSGFGRNDPILEWSFKINIKIKVKGSGQECPLHTDTAIPAKLLPC